jgi:hypothetical protein
MCVFRSARGNGRAPEYARPDTLSKEQRETGVNRERNSRDAYGEQHRSVGQATQRPTRQLEVQFSPLIDQNKLPSRGEIRTEQLSF